MDVQEGLRLKVVVTDNVCDGGVRVVLEHDGDPEPEMLPVLADTVRLGLGLNVLEVVGVGDPERDTDPLQVFVEDGVPLAEGREKDRVEVMDLLGDPLWRVGVPDSVVLVRGVAVGETEAVDEAVGVGECNEPEGVGDRDVDTVLVGREDVRDVDTVRETVLVVERVPERLVVPDTRCEVLRDPVGEREEVAVQLKVCETETVRDTLSVPKADSVRTDSDGVGGVGVRVEVRDPVAFRVAERLALQLDVAVQLSRLRVLL